ncbi:hypothetical protein MTO96_042118 [Rhipicephalus appendiculatus]
MDFTEYRHRLQATHLPPEALMDILVEQMHVVATPRAQLQQLPMAHSRKCGCLEKPPKYKTCKDAFCRPDHTPDAVKRQHHRCVCRLGAYRNPWGECITLEECRSCGTFRTKSYNTCASECPMRCDQPIPNCSSRCVARCDCAPGYIL